MRADEMIPLEHNFAGRRLKHGTLGADVPRSTQSPLIQRGVRGRRVGLSCVMSLPLGRCEALNLAVAFVGFGRLHIRAGRRLHSISGNANDPAPEPAAPFAFRSSRITCSPRAESRLTASTSNIKRALRSGPPGTCRGGLCCSDPHLLPCI